ncbi:hypothetical protein CQW23_06587 [Capsicum baccatum]|uniref:Uncharacterized protein n=1 Tax=Capsicum baccatum TaxID=33114 RepID=A0A2G2X3Q6_CAPBA|nr:hypothetical protein CQW23_06587 [Capsicum baccatum]
MSALTEIESYTPKKPDCELKNRPTTNTPFDEPPMVESQELPDYLKYVFLESRNILSERTDDLSEQHVEALISALRRYKRAMGWTIDDIIGDSPEKRMSQLEKDRMTTGEQHERGIFGPYWCIMAHGLEGGLGVRACCGPKIDQRMPGRLEILPV